FSRWTYCSRASPIAFTTSRVLSTEPSSTTTSSKSSNVWPRTLVMAVPTRSARLCVHSTTLIIATSDRPAPDEKRTLSGDWHPPRHVQGCIWVVRMKGAGVCSTARREVRLVSLATPGDASGQTVSDHTFCEVVHDESPRTDDRVGADRRAVDHVGPEAECRPV